MTQTGIQRLEELPLEDLKWELENRLDNYLVLLPSKSHIWKVNVFEESIQQLSPVEALTDGAFRVKASCICSACERTEVLEIKLQPSPPGFQRPWTIVYVRDCTSSGHISIMKERERIKAFEKSHPSSRKRGVPSPERPEA